MTEKRFTITQDFEENYLILKGFALKGFLKNTCRKVVLKILIQ